eukprot:jgi/Ulvmu1/10186/UM006_0142.1
MIALLLHLAVIKLANAFSVNCEGIDVLCQKCPAVDVGGNAIPSLPPRVRTRAWLMGSVEARSQICGTYWGNFLPMLEFDAHRVYSDQWRASSQAVLPEFAWGNGTRVARAIFPGGLRLTDDLSACSSPGMPACVATALPHLTTGIVRSNVLSERAILNVFIILDAHDSPRYVASSMTEGIHWNIYVEHAALEQELQVSIESNTWQTGNGVSKLSLSRWCIRWRSRAAAQPMHVVLLEGDDGANTASNTSSVQVFINSRLAYRKPTGASFDRTIRTLQLLHISQLDIGARRNLQTGAVMRQSGFRLVHVEAVPATHRVTNCQIALMMQDAQHRWDLVSAAMNKLFTMLLWESSHYRVSAWYPHTWARVLVQPDGAFGVLTVLHSFATSASRYADERRSVLSPDRLIIASCNRVGHSWLLTDSVACAHTDLPQSQLQQLTCGNSSDGGLGVQAAASCRAVATRLEDKVVVSVVEQGLQAYSAAQARESRVAAALGGGTAVAGAATNLVISQSMGLAAANSGELGMAMLSGGANMGISALVAGLQWLAMSARLPVRHCRLMYSLSAGSAWASLDVMSDTSGFNRHDPSVLVRAAQLSTATAAADMAAPTGDATASAQPSVGHPPQAAGGHMPGPGRRRLQTATDASLQAAREAAGVLDAAWDLGFVRLIVFVGAIVLMVTLHSVSLVAWQHIGALSEWPLPRMLAFPRLEAIVLLAMATALGEACGLLFASGSASAASAAVLAAGLYSVLLAAAGYVVVVFIFYHSRHGLHYFVGVSDWTHTKGGHRAYLWQTLLYDRLHGFWSSASQVRPADLEPHRTERHVASNISMPAAARLLMTLAQLGAQRARVQDKYLSTAQAELTAARSTMQRRRRRTMASIGASMHVASLDRLDSVPSAGSLRTHRSMLHLSKRPSLPQQQLSALESVQLQRVPEAQPEAQPAAQPAAAPPVPATAGAAKARCTGLGRVGLGDQQLQHVSPALRESVSDVADPAAGVRVTDDTAPGNASVLLKQTSRADCFLPPSEARGSASTDDLAEHVAAAAPLYSTTKPILGMRHSSLLRIPKSVDLVDGWTAGHELELAAAASEVLDRFGVLFEQHQGHCLGPVLYVLIRQVMQFSNGVVVGALIDTEPGTAGAWAGLSLLLLLKAVHALLMTALRPQVDVWDMLGEACAAWLNVGSCICMLALQPYYTQEVESAEDAVLAKVLEGGGFAEGVEGWLQLAVLVLSIMSIAASMMGVWGFVVLRLLARQYVKKEVAAIASGTRARVQPRALEVPGIGPDLQVHLAQRVADMQQQLRRTHSSRISAALHASSSIAADILAAALPAMIAPQAHAAGSNVSSFATEMAALRPTFRTGALAANFLTRLRIHSTHAGRVAPSHAGPTHMTPRFSGLLQPQGSAAVAWQAAARTSVAEQHPPSSGRQGPPADAASSPQPADAAPGQPQPPSNAATPPSPPEPEGRPPVKSTIRGTVLAKERQQGEQWSPDAPWQQ